MKDKAPWYRHVWVWVIILLPLSVVVASGYTFYLAHTHAPVVIQKQDRFGIDPKDG